MPFSKMSAENTLSKQVFGPASQLHGCKMSCTTSVSTVEISSSLKAAGTISTSLSFLTNGLGLALLLLGAMLTSIFTLNGLLIGLIGTVAFVMCDAPMPTIISVSAVILAILGAAKMHETYQAFANLGPGNFSSPSIANFIRMAAIARSNAIRATSEETLGNLHPLPLRQGATPYVIGHAPQVQLNQHTPEDVQSYFSDRLALFAALQSNIGSTSSGLRKCISGRNVRGFGCSACQPSTSGGAVHVILHPADLEHVITMGWGERHPLACKGIFSLVGASCLPATLVLVYAPRKYNDVCVVMSLIEAGAKFLSDIEGGRA